MSDASPAEEYWAACKIYGTIELLSHESPTRLQDLRAQQSVLRFCVQRLAEEANSHNPAVWHALGNALETGKGVAQDRAEALCWYQQAAEAGHLPAMVSLARRLQCPTPTDPSTAIGYFIAGQLRLPEV
jgi:TPR repeat protein